MMERWYGVNEEVKHGKACGSDHGTARWITAGHPQIGSARHCGEEGEARCHLDGAGHDEDELSWLDVEEEVRPRTMLKAAQTRRRGGAQRHRLGMVAMRSRGLVAARCRGMASWSPRQRMMTFVCSQLLLRREQRRERCDKARVMVDDRRIGEVRRWCLVQGTTTELWWWLDVEEGEVGLGERNPTRAVQHSHNKGQHGLLAVMVGRAPGGGSAG